MEYCVDVSTWFGRMVRGWPRLVTLVLASLFVVPVSFDVGAAWRDGWFILGTSEPPARVPDLDCDPLLDGDVYVTAHIRLLDTDGEVRTVKLYADASIASAFAVDSPKVERNPLGHVRLQGTRFHPVAPGALMACVLAASLGWFGVIIWTLYRRYRRRDFARSEFCVAARVTGIVSIPEEEWVTRHPESWVCYEYRLAGEIHAHRHRIREDAANAVPSTIDIAYEPGNPKDHIILTKL